MRLTLRTLLAYLDDTLEPSQAKLIGQKVAESDTAQELIARIKQVTHRRRLTTPSEKGPGGKVDPNSIAEYLDNTLTSDQLAEVEQLCLSSDVHLAEMAACHQILTLVLGEPALVPPTAKQRMYGLVKGRESIQFRKPAASTRLEPESLAVEGRDVDETLRLGLPVPVKGKLGNRLILIGGGLLLVLFLSIALWQLIASSQLPDPDLRSDKQRAQVDVKPPTDKGVKDGNPTDKDKGTNDKKDTSDLKDKGTKDKKNPVPDDKKVVVKEKEKKPDPDLEGDSGKASLVVSPIGVYEAPEVASSSVLLQLLPKGSQRRSGGKNLETPGGRGQGVVRHAVGESAGLPQ